MYEIGMLCYGDDPAGEYAVELHDQVEVRIGGATFEGVVKRIHPSSHEVTVRYQDHVDAKRNGDPKTKSARVHVLAVDLIARDGVRSGACLTKEAWAEIEKQLESSWTPVYLDCDGYVVRLGLERVSKMRLGFTV